MTAVLEAPLTTRGSRTNADRLRITLQECGISPISPSVVRSYKHKALRREKLQRLALALLIGVLALGAFLLTRLLPNSNSLVKLIACGLDIMTLVLVVIAVGLVITTVLAKWTQTDYRLYKPYNGVPDAVDQLVSDLRQLDPTLRFTVHHTDFDPLLEVHRGDTSEFIAAWPHNGRDVELIDLT